MSRWERWTFNALNLVVGISGVLYLWMKYLLDTDDPFAVVNHPWQPFTLALHVVAAPLLMMAFGIVFRSHVLAKLASNERRGRISGWTSCLSFGLMAMSGYLLQVASDPGWLRGLVIAHVGSGVLFGMGYSVHLAILLRLKVPHLNPRDADPRAVNPS